MTDTKHWITKLVPVFAFAAGIIIAAVGGIITTSSVMKLAFFETEPYNYYSSEECLYDYNQVVPASAEVVGIDKATKPYKLSPEEVAACKAEKELEAKKRFQNTEKQDIVDGISSLLVGGILILSFKKRK